MKAWRRSARVSPVTEPFSVTASTTGGEVADLEWNWPFGTDPDEFRLQITNDGINWQLQGPPFEAGSARMATFDETGFTGQTVWFEVLARTGGVTIATAVSNTVVVI